MLLRIGQALHDHRVAVITAWLLLAAALQTAAPPWDEVARDGDLQFLPADTTTARALALHDAAFPGEEGRSQLLVVFARADGPLVREDLLLLAELREQIASQPDLPIISVLTENAEGADRIPSSPTDHARRFAVRLANDFMATDNVRVLQNVQAMVEDAQERAPQGLEIGLTGSAAIGGDLLAAAADSVRNTHTATIALVVCVLAVIYRSLRLMLVPLVTIGIAATVSLATLPMLAELTATAPDWLPSVEVFTTTRIFVVVLLFGAGTDYCLFLTARYSECRGEDMTPRDSTAEAFSRVGVALAASGATTIVGLAMMAVADFGKIAGSGVSIAISLAITLAACLTLTPALLASTLGSAASGQLRAAQQQGSGFWNKLAEFVLRYPRALLLGSVAAALPLAIHGATVGVTYDLLAEISPERISRRGTALLKQYYPAGEIGPLVVLAERDGADFASTDGRRAIAELGKALHEVPGVARVRSLDQPLGDAPGATVSGTGLRALVARRSPEATAAFVSQAPDTAGDVTRLIVLLEDEPFSKEAVATCNRITARLAKLPAEDSFWEGAAFPLLGPTPGIRDLKAVTTADRYRVQACVTGAVLLVMVALLRRPVVCVYLVATVLLSYLVTIGATSLLFGLARGDGYLGLDWKVPLFLFVLLVAVGQDYNIYLVSRVFEEQRRMGRLPGLRHALIQTGGIITSCGIIMAGTFVSMTAGSMRGIVEMGFALSLGILLDTLYVRTLLVPAFLSLPSWRPSPGPEKQEAGGPHSLPD